MYLVLADHCTLPLTDKGVQKAIDDELEVAKMEWDYFVFLHQMKPDKHLCIEVLSRFIKETLPRLTCTQMDVEKKDFIFQHQKQLLEHKQMNQSKFSKENFDFILSSEQYYAEKYYKDHSNSPLGYKDLDIRLSVKAKVSGLMELKRAFQQRYDQLYHCYEQLNENRSDTHV